MACDAVEAPPDPRIIVCWAEAKPGQSPSRASHASQVFRLTETPLYSRFVRLNKCKRPFISKSRKIRVLRDTRVERDLISAPVNPHVSELRVSPVVKDKKALRFMQAVTIRQIGKTRFRLKFPKQDAG